MANETSTTDPTVRLFAIWRGDQGLSPHFKDIAHVLVEATFHSRRFLAETPVGLVNGKLSYPIPPLSPEHCEPVHLFRPGANGPLRSPATHQLQFIPIYYRQDYVDLVVWKPDSGVTLTITQDNLNKYICTFDLNGEAYRKTTQLFADVGINWKAHYDAKPLAKTDTYRPKRSLKELGLG